jgi:hypothetical protein
MAMEMTIPLFLRRDAVKPSFKSAAPVSSAVERRFRSLQPQPSSTTFLQCLAVHMYFAEHPSALD